jgi:hypothetical protein
VLCRRGQRGRPASRWDQLAHVPDGSGVVASATVRERVRRSPILGHQSGPPADGEQETLVIWHIVRFDMSSLDEATRASLDADLAALERLDCVEQLHVGPDLTEPHITGLVSAFADEQALDTYRVHPDHLPVVERVRSLGIPVVRLDIAGGDPTGTPA